MHTADGISIRFPRVTRIRDDKDWETATNLHELRALFKNSAESIDYSLLLGAGASKRPAGDDNVTKKKSKRSNRPDDEEPSTSKRNIKLEDNEDLTMDADDKVKMEVAERDEEKISGKGKLDRKKSPQKSPGKLITQFFNENKVIKKEKKNDSYSRDEMKDDSRAEFYSFIGTDVSEKNIMLIITATHDCIYDVFQKLQYIEYNAAGSPLNWITGRKPPEHLPKDAKPINERDENKMVR